MIQNFIHNFKDSLFSKFTVYTIITFVLVVPCLSLADGGTLANPLKAESFSDLIAAILQIMIQLGTPIAAICFVYTGFVFVTSEGDPKKLDTAKSMFFWTVIGTAIILGATIILQILQSTVQSLK